MLCNSCTSALVEEGAGEWLDLSKIEKLHKAIGGMFVL